jgi:hypothetical protein
LTAPAALEPRYQVYHPARRIQLV